MNTTLTDRREFLKIAFLGATGAYLLSVKNLYGIEKNSLLVIADGFEEPVGSNPYQPVLSQNGAILFWEIEKKKYSKIDLSFRGHAIAQNPVRKSHFMTFEKWGHHMACVDYETKKIVYTIVEKGRRFFGHGFFDETGKTLYVSQYDDNKKMGFIGVYESMTGKRIGEISTFGAFPHDCQLKDSETLIVLNRKGKGINDQALNSMNWINLKTGKQTDKVIFDLDNNHVLYHFHQFKDGWIVASGASETKPGENPGCVVAISPDKVVTKISAETGLLKELIGESLSLSGTKEEDVVAITSPLGNAIYLWSFKKNVIRKKISINSPRGILLFREKNQLIISSGLTRELIKYDLNNEKIVKESSLGKRWGNGSHIYLYDV